jgi:aryl-alcohol dehydrogenase-like predicted oxidoreductase
MEHRPLGRTGVSVSKLCLGTMMFGAWGEPDHVESIRIIHAALDAGIDFVDTADVYSAGESEEILGKALKGRRNQVVLATSCRCQSAMTRSPTGVGHQDAGSSRRSRTRCGDCRPTTSTSTRSTARHLIPISKRHSTH